MPRPKYEPVEIKERPDGKLDVWIRCEFCGKPITVTGDFGMDCEDHCAEKKFNQKGGNENAKKN